MQQGLRIPPTVQDLEALDRAIQNTAPKIRYWYQLEDTRGRSIDEQAIIEQTHPQTDFEKLSATYDFMEENEYTTKQVHLSAIRTKKRTLKDMLGFKDWTMCVYNPQTPVTQVTVGKKEAHLIQIDSLNFGNCYEGRVHVENRYAVLKEEDQDIAHRLRLMFSPQGVLETDPCTPSDTRTNKDKPRPQGFEIYCDNVACQKEIRNPMLILDTVTRGIYHSTLCYAKDIRIKAYQGIRGSMPTEILLCDAQEMYREGELQQSKGFRLELPELRRLEGIEPVIVFPH